MRQICFICKSPYDEAGNGIGEAAHFAVRHNLLALETYNGRNAADQWAKVVARGADSDDATYHAWNMDFGETIEPGVGNERCVESGCNARRARGYYCPMHSSASAARTRR